MRKFFQRRPWGHDQIALAEHFATPWAGDAEFEVDEVVRQKFAYGKYKYSVSLRVAVVTIASTCHATVTV
jgi:hypothetical protein